MNYFDSRDILKITDKLQDKIEDLECDLEKCCSKHPVNCGDGIGIYKDYKHGHWNFKTLVAGDNITIEDEGCEIVISATGGGGSFDCSDLNSCSTTNLPEGTNLYFTDERAQDAVGTILTNSAQINLTYNDGVPSITASFVSNNISQFTNDSGYIVCADVNACITGTPTEILYYDGAGNLTSDAEFYRVLNGKTFIKSTNPAGQSSYIDLNPTYLELYNDFTASDDGGRLRLDVNAALGTVVGGGLQSYLYVLPANFQYVNTATGVTFTYPNMDGANGDVLTTDGAGGLTLQPIPAGFITAIADTNTVDLVEAAGTLTANVRYQDTTDIDLSDDASGLKADLTTTGVVANTYGDASNVAQITVDSKGRITTAVEVEIDCTDDFIKGYRAMGSVIKAQKLGMTIQQITASTNLSDQQLLWNAVYICNTTTISGAMWYQSVQGSYTANNYNGIGLYSYSGGTLTLVASSTDDGNIWKTAANTYGTKAFSASYAASPGIYFVAFLYCRSAQVTAPAIGSSPVVANAGVWALDFTNSIRPYLFLNGQTALPTPILASATGGAGTSNIWVGIY